MIQEKKENMNDIGEVINIMFTKKDVTIQNL